MTYKRRTFCTNSSFLCFENFKQIKMPKCACIIIKYIFVFDNNTGTLGQLLSGSVNYKTHSGWIENVYAISLIIFWFNNDKNPVYAKITTMVQKLLIIISDISITPTTTHDPRPTTMTHDHSLKYDLLTYHSCMLRDMFYRL